jgi:hypothetical protein
MMDSFANRGTEKWETAQPASLTDRSAAFEIRAPLVCTAGE